jgi:hypothetical protein
MDLPKIEVYDDLVDESLINEVINITRRIGFRYGWKSNNQVSFSHWNVALSRTGTSSNNRNDIRGELPPPVLKLWESFQPTLLPNTPVLIRTYSNGYTYGNDGYIHQDSQAPEDMSAIIYLNKDWNANFAGETALFDSTGEIIRSVLPKWRRLLIFPANMYHVGRGVSRICPHLRNVLVFKARPEQPVQVDNSRVAIEKTLLEAGIENTPVAETITLDQLLKTYDNLKNWNCPHPVCFAGALHALYIPNAALKQSFPDLIRPHILELFGTEADRLATLFATVDIPKLVSDSNATNKFDGSSIALQENDKQYLMLFQTANLMDKSPLIDPKAKMQELLNTEQGKTATQEPPKE